ncbi:MAG TPA: T9SS type A sorting domain-containing protein [Ignavibacteria bacterium]|nr:T9SS type A sorting domain-containing protein [Ignavibacteria bacterium]
MKNIFRISFICIIAVSGLFLFQAQDINYGDDPRFDQVPADMQNYHRFPTNPEPLVVTDAFGFDNFDVGINNAEQWITQNPNNSFQMIFGVNSTNWYHSEDGINWAYNNPTPSSSGDPIAAYDSVGNGYAQLLGSGNRVWRTTNNGVTWTGGIPSVPGGDRNTLAADQTGGPYANRLYASAWSPGANFAMSTNFGASWTTTVSGAPNTTPGNMIAVGPDGNIQGGCVYWVTITGTNPAPTTFNFYRSTNGGANFTLVNSTVQPGWVGTLLGGRLTVNNCRTRPYPFIAADNSYGPYRGRLYIVYASNSPAGNGNKPDVFCQYSANQGETFSSPVRVNDNSSPELSDQWFPAVWCDKYTGRLYIKWYDTRNNPATFGVDVYATYSMDGGVSFASNQKLTTANWVYPCPPVSGGSYCGDYDGICGNKFSAIAVWTDMRNCNRQNMLAYFPDFAMKVNPATLGLNGINDSGFSYVSAPGVKLYSQKVRYTAAVTPPPSSGTITVSFLNRTNSTIKDTLTTFPDSLRVRIKTSGGVTPGVYTVSITGSGRIGGENGTPVHKRNITLDVVTGITQYNNEIPDNFYLYQNYPNPFNPQTNIRFDIAKAGNVKLTVFDVTGKQVAELINGDYTAGKYVVYFDGANISSGIYFYKIETPDFVQVRKMMMVK